MKLNNKYYIMRHGQAISNVKDICSCWPEKFKNPLTKIGKEKAKETALNLKNTCAKQNQSIDMIFCSPLLRTKMTAEIVGKILKLKPKTDKRLREQNVGIFNNQSLPKFKLLFGEHGIHRFKIRPKNGETYLEIEKRMVDFLKSTDKKYKNKTILIVSHQLPLLFLDCAVKGISHTKFYERREKMNTAQARELN